MDAYSVGITVYLTDRATSAMSSVSRAMLQAGQHTDQLKQRIQGLHDTLGKMQILGEIGHNMFHGGVNAIEAMTDAAKEYSFTLNKLQGQGIAVADMHKAVAASHANSNRDLTTTFTSNLKNVGDLNVALGSMNHATEMLPAFTDAIKIMRTSGEMKTAHQAEHLTQEGARAMELSGDALPTRSQAYKEEHLDMMRRAVTATNGLMTFKDFHNFNKQAGVARTGYDDDYKYKASPYFMQEMGGLRTGTASANINRALVQGMMTVNAAKNLQREGLITSHEEITKKNYRAITGKSIIGQQSADGADFVHNPYRAVNEAWKPTILAHHPEIAAIKDSTKQNQKVAELINKLQLNDKATSYLALMAVSQPGVEKHIAQYNRIPKRAEAIKIADQSPVNIAAAAAAQWQNLLITIGTNYLPIINRGMTEFAQGINQVIQFLQAHPMVATLTAAAVAAVTLVGGVIAVGAGFGMLVVIAGAVGLSFGWVAAAIGAAVVVATSFIAAVMNWDKIVAWIREQIRGHMDGIKLAIAIVVDITTVASQKIKEFASAIGAFIGQVAGAISNLHIPLPGMLGALQEVAKTMDSVGKGKVGQDYIAKQKAAHPEAFGALDKFMGNNSKPAYSSQTANAGAGKSSKTVNNISLNVHQQPGEDGFALAKKVGSILMEGLQNNMAGSSAGGGVFESQFHFGGSPSG